MGGVAELAPRPLVHACIADHGAPVVAREARGQRRTQPITRLVCEAHWAAANGMANGDHLHQGDLPGQNQGS